LNIVLIGVKLNQMVELAAPLSNQALDLVFHALADTTRRNIIKRIAGKSLTVSEIAKPFRMSLAAVSKHLKVLERAGLIHRQKQGTAYHMTLNAEALMNAEEWLAHYRQFWEQRLDALQHLLEKERQ
jgi:DNA-binding transcriptional ArsR family regulator